VEGRGDGRGREGRGKRSLAPALSPPIFYSRTATGLADDQTVSACRTVSEIFSVNFKKMA